MADSAFADLRETLTRELESSDHLPSPVAAYALVLYRLLSGTDPADVAPAAVIGRIAPGPILLIQGGSDQTVSVVDSERLLAAADSPTAERWVVPGGRHVESYFADPGGYTSRVVGFFAAAIP